ncbi:MAG: hypothetical protein QXG05_00180 [Nitrososphaerota archaeon]
MSSAEVKAKLKETAKSIKELLDATVKMAHKQLSTTTPKVASMLDNLIKEATKVMSDTLKAIDKRTAPEQLELLKVYRDFIDKQRELVQRKIDAIEKNETKKKE